jgi:hypothetical protein
MLYPKLENISVYILKALYSPDFDIIVPFLLRYFDVSNKQLSATM